jgi:hypothetical protein
MYGVDGDGSEPVARFFLERRRRYVSIASPIERRLVFLINMYAEHIFIL